MRQTVRRISQHVLLQQCAGEVDHLPRLGGRPLLAGRGGADDPDQLAGGRVSPLRLSAGPGSDLRPPGRLQLHLGLPLPPRPGCSRLLHHPPGLQTEGHHHYQPEEPQQWLRKITERQHSRAQHGLLLRPRRQTHHHPHHLQHGHLPVRAGDGHSDALRLHGVLRVITSSQYRESPLTVLLFPQRAAVRDQARGVRLPHPGHPGVLRVSHVLVALQVPGLPGQVPVRPLRAVRAVARPVHKLPARQAVHLDLGLQQAAHQHRHRTGDVHRLLSLGQCCVGSHHYPPVAAQVTSSNLQ